MMKYTKEKIKKDIKEVYHTIDNFTLNNVCNLENIPSKRTILRYFGTWNNLLTECELPILKGSRKPKTTIKCFYCESETTNPKFCSRSCSASSSNSGYNRRENKLRINLECISCGDKFLGKYNLYEKKYCSTKCQQQYRWDRKIELIKQNVLSSEISKNNIKRFLVEQNNTCSECGIGSTWNNKPLTLEMDHIDGDSSNDILSNCRLLCPNCHTQTPTYKFKNSRNPLGKDHRRKRYLKQLK